MTTRREATLRASCFAKLELFSPKFKWTTYWPLSLVRVRFRFYLKKCSLQTTPVKIRRPNILRRKPKTPKKAEVKIELLESA